MYKKEHFVCARYKMFWHRTKRSGTRTECSCLPHTTSAATRENEDGEGGIWPGDHWPDYRPLSCGVCWEPLPPHPPPTHRTSEPLFSCQRLAVQQLTFSHPFLRSFLSPVFSVLFPCKLSHPTLPLC